MLFLIDNSFTPLIGERLMASSQKATVFANSLVLREVVSSEVRNAE